MILSVQESAVLRALAQFASTKEHERASECLEAIGDALGVKVDFDLGNVTSLEPGNPLQVNLCIILLHAFFYMLNSVRASIVDTTATFTRATASLPSTFHAVHQRCIP
jgi:hypothetical protein